MSFDTRRAACAEAIEGALSRAISGHDTSLPVVQAMRYAAEGGKRLRGFLVMEGARLHGLSDETALPAALAIEAVHAYSLVHDDLPCMDDDDLRRGRPTVHRAWDEATAVLAGDALQTLAFEALSTLALPPERTVAMVASLAVAAGAKGMVMGQALDIAAETQGEPPGLDDIVALQGAKTGRLLEWSAAAGARMAGADETALLTYGRAIGLAFQIADDILDETGSEAAAGKRLHKDRDAGKATFVSLLGLDAAQEKAKGLVAEAEAALARYGDEAETLREAARFIVTRSH